VELFPLSLIKSDLEGILEFARAYFLSTPKLGPIPVDFHSKLVKDYKHMETMDYMARTN
jgi:hypothetical protein